MIQGLKLSRKNDPTFVKNPFTGRYVKKGSSIHKQLMADGIVGFARDTKNIIATGSIPELKSMKQKLEESDSMDFTNYKLLIVGNRLLKRRIPIPRSELVDHTIRHSVKSAVSNRMLMNSKLTDDQLSTLLTKVCDASIMGVDLDLSYEFDKIMKLNEPAPKKEEEVKAETTLPKYNPKLVRSKKKFVRRFKVTPAPVIDTTTCCDTTEFETSDCFTDSD